MSGYGRGGPPPPPRIDGRRCEPRCDERPWLGCRGGGVACGGYEEGEGADADNARGGRVPERRLRLLLTLKVGERGWEEECDGDGRLKKHRLHDARNARRALGGVGLAWGERACDGRGKKSAVAHWGGGIDLRE